MYAGTYPFLKEFNAITSSMCRLHRSQLSKLQSSPTELRLGTVLLIAFIMTIRVVERLSLSVECATRT
jgi:hypothetical protein